ncbi:hypothetical protein HDU98_004389 [Podochytrium sp. JEL0797]|nr:hypothetical protein HDU98_004389 [Podochytrium sp. JEL0797]
MAHPATCPDPKPLPTDSATLDALYYRLVFLEDRVSQQADLIETLRSRIGIQPGTTSAHSLDAADQTQDEQWEDEATLAVDETGSECSPGAVYSHDLLASPMLLPGNEKTAFPSPQPERVSRAIQPAAARYASDSPLPEATPPPPLATVSTTRSNKRSLSPITWESQGRYSKTRSPVMIVEKPRSPLPSATAAITATTTASTGSSHFFTRLDSFGTSTPAAAVGGDRGGVGGGEGDMICANYSRNMPCVMVTGKPAPPQRGFKAVPLQTVAVFTGIVMETRVTGAVRLSCVSLSRDNLCLLQFRAA